MNPYNIYVQTNISMWTDISAVSLRHLHCNKYLIINTKFHTKTLSMHSTKILLVCKMHNSHTYNTLYMTPICNG